MTTLQFRTGNVSVFGAARSGSRTGDRRGAASLDEQLDRDYALLPLQFPNPDAAELPVAAEYARYVSKHYEEPTGELLDRLSDEHGLMWLTIAKVAQVSVPALRKWRQGGNPTDANKLALSRLLAACGRLDELGVRDVAGWLNTPIRLDQNRLRVELLTLPDGGEPLLKLAADVISPDQALDVLDPTWRNRRPHATGEVTFDADGIGTVHLSDG